MAWLWAHVGASQQDSRRRRRRCRRDCTPATADGNVVRAGTWASRLRPSRETCSSLVPALGPCIITRAHCRARKTAHAEVMERGAHSAHSRMRTLVQQACVRDPPRHHRGCVLLVRHGPAVLHAVPGPRARPSRHARTHMRVVPCRRGTPMATPRGRASLAHFTAAFLTERRRRHRRRRPPAVLRTAAARPPSGSER